MDGCGWKAVDGCLREDARVMDADVMEKELVDEEVMDEEVMGECIAQIVMELLDTQE